MNAALGRVQLGAGRQAKEGHLPHGLFGRRRVSVAAICLLAAGIFQIASAPACRASAKSCRPSAQQLERLRDLEPYISYFTSINYGAEDARISRDYIRALILTESGGDPGAQSAFGARGVTQI